MISNARSIPVYVANPDFVAESCALKLTLTYEGSLSAARRSFPQGNPAKVPPNPAMSAIEPAAKAQPLNPWRRA